MTNLLRVLYYLALARKRLYWNSDKLRGYQEKRLRSIVRYAYNFVPFYHKSLRKAGIKPEDIRTLKDLAKLRIIRKDELGHEHPSELVSRESRMEKLKVLRTSGSTGNPFSFYINEKENDWRKALYMRGNIACGQRPRDRWVVVTAPHHFFDTTSLQRRLGIFAQACVSLFDPIDKQVKTVARLEPDILDGYSGSLLLLAQEAKQQAMKEIRPRIIFGTADLIGAESRMFVENVFNAPFYDQFGCAEIDRTAWQCREKNGYHMDVDSVIVQFVDAEGNEVSAGEEGEVVYTSLFSYTQPFIRYAIDDVGELLDGECSCGVKLPLMKVVKGRKDSFLILPDGRVLAPMSFWTVMRYFKYADYIERFRVVQKELGRIEILVKRSRTSPFSEEILRKEIAGHVAKCLRVDTSKGFSIEIEFVEELPLDKSGKLRSVVSLLPTRANQHSI